MISTFFCGTSCGGGGAGGATAMRMGLVSWKVVVPPHPRTVTRAIQWAPPQRTLLHIVDMRFAFSCRFMALPSLAWRLIFVLVIDRDSNGCPRQHPKFLRARA